MWIRFFKMYTILCVCIYIFLVVVFYFFSVIMICTMYIGTYITIRRPPPPLPPLHHHHHCTCLNTSSYLPCHRFSFTTHSGSVYRHSCNFQVEKSEIPKWMKRKSSVSQLKQPQSRSSSTFSMEHTYIMCFIFTFSFRICRVFLWFHNTYATLYRAVVYREQASTHIYIDMNTLP